MQTRKQLALHSARFYEWERLGRGTETFTHLVPLEPPFRTFVAHQPTNLVVVDDGRRPTALSRFWDRITRKVPAREPLLEIQKDLVPLELPVPDTEPSELEMLFPEDLKVDPKTVFAFWNTIATVGQPLSFELVGFSGRVSVRITSAAHDSGLIHRYASTFFPAATVDEPEQSLVRLWRKAETEFVAGAEFGLSREFMVPLAYDSKGAEFLTGLIGSLSQAGETDVAVFQVLLCAARHPWTQSALAAVTSPDGEPFLLDAPEVTKLAEEKFSTPLISAVIRTFAWTKEEVVARDILRAVVAAVSPSRTDRNALVPLTTENIEDFEYNVLLRCTNRSGMLLSLAELSSVARLPGAEITTPALVRTRITSRLPEEVLGDTGVIIGEAEHEGVLVPVRLPLEARLSHTYVIGASGTGKSTLLESLITQDIANGAGLALIDPHGDLVESILARIPADRVNDVVLFDPADPAWVVGWNILAARSETEKQMLASDLVAVWKRLSTSWGDQMSAVLGNAVLAFLESSIGGTLVDLRKFLLDDKFRAAFLDTVADNHIRSFWKEEYALLVGRNPQAPILTRLDMLLRSRLVREAVVERERPLDFRAIVDGRKILLAKLAQGAIGEENASLLGSLLVSKLHQTALSRQDAVESAREPFFLYIDEFHNTATPSMASLFSGVRKYKLALCVAHQDLYQLHTTAPELERSILANAHTRIAFRLSEDDARRVERGMGEFGEEDLVNLERGEAICRVGRGANTFRLRTVRLPDIPTNQKHERAAVVRATSFERFGRQRPVEAMDNVHDKLQSGGPAIEVAPGRGGKHHKYLQGLIRRAAIERGFEVEVEKRVLDGHGHVDVSLTRGDFRIACEISVSTGVEHEFLNVLKCLTAGYHFVVLVSSEQARLDEAERRLNTEVAGESRAKIRLLSPTNFISFLDELPSQARSTSDSGERNKTLEKPKRRAESESSQEIPADPQALLDVSQTASYVRRAAQTLAKLRCVGGGPLFYKIGKNVYYKRADLDEWLASRRRRVTSIGS
jgi:DNA helicase HerA-like ATPase